MFLYLIFQRKISVDQFSFIFLLMNNDPKKSRARPEPARNLKKSYKFYLLAAFSHLKKCYLEGLFKNNPFKC